MTYKHNGFSVNISALQGYTKKRFCEEFRSANKTLRPKTIEEVWEEIKKDIPKKPRKKTEPKKVEIKASSEEE